MQTIAFVVFDGFSSMALAAQPVFEAANSILGEEKYHAAVFSEHGGLVSSSGGLSIMTAPLEDNKFDTVIIAGGTTAFEDASEGLIRFVRSSFESSRRVASICTGAFVLAQAGLLDGRRVTTHWACARSLKERFPTVILDEDRIFVKDDKVWTSAGMTAGIDLALAMVEEDHGPDVARRVAQALVMYHRRAGGQSQHSALLDMGAKSDRIQTALTYVRANLSRALTVEDLAEVARLSPRQFSRAFKAETGHSPAKAVENLRLEAARLMMEQSRHSIDEIAGQTGFIDRRRMREACLRGFDQPPQVIRRNARQGVI